MVEGMSRRLVRAGLSEVEAVAIAGEVQTAIAEAMWKRMEGERWKDHLLVFMVIVCCGSLWIPLVRLFAR